MIVFFDFQMGYSIPYVIFTPCDFAIYELLAINYRIFAEFKFRKMKCMQLKHSVQLAKVMCMMIWTAHII